MLGIYAACFPSGRRSLASQIGAIYEGSDEGDRLNIEGARVSDEVDESGENYGRHGQVRESV